MQWVTADKDLLARRSCRCRATYERAATVQTEMAGQLVDDLLRAAGTDVFDDALELGCGTGLLTRQLLARCRVQRLTLNDLSEGFARALPRAPSGAVRTGIVFTGGDMESAPLPANQDLVISSAVLQWAADLPALLERLVARLKPGGLFAAASFGPSTLAELAALTGSSLRYGSVDTFRSALSGSCEILCARQECRVLHFASAREVLDHLRQTGVNALDARPWPPGRLRRFCADYQARFEQDGVVPLTYYPVFVVARKRGEDGCRTRREIPQNAGEKK